MFIVSTGPSGVPVVNGRIEVSTTTEDGEPIVLLDSVERDADRAVLMLTASQTRILIATLKQHLKELS